MSDLPEEWVRFVERPLDDLVVVNEIIAFAHLELQRALHRPVNSPQELIALASLIQRAFEALDARRQLEDAWSGNPPASRAAASGLSDLAVASEPLREVG
mgnify:CR=1 FL=1